MHRNALGAVDLFSGSQGMSICEFVAYKRDVSTSPKAALLFSSKKIILFR